MKKIHPDILEEIVEMGEGGMSVAAIADELEVSPMTVYKYLREAGVPTNRAREHTLMERVDTEQIVEDYLAWRPINYVLQNNDITRSQLYYILRTIGVPARTQEENWVEAQKMRLDHAVELYQRGEPLYHIKAETGIPQPQLHEELYKRNIPLRRPRISQLPSDEEVRQRIKEALDD